MKKQPKPEEFDFSRWTVSRLKQLCGQKLVRFSTHVFATMAACRILVGRCLLAVEATRLYRDTGHSDAINFAKEHGVPEREAEDSLRLARYLEELPKMSRAVETGRLGWSALKAIAPKASPDTEERWLELADQNRVHTLEKIAARTGKGEMPGDPGSEPATTEASAVVLKLRVSPEVAVLFQHATRDISHDLGQAVSAHQAFELLVVHYHTGAQHADDQAVEALLDQARLDLAAQAEADQKEVDRALDSAEATGSEPAGEGPSSEASREAVEGTPADSEDTSRNSPTWGDSPGGHSIAGEPDGLHAWGATVTSVSANPAQPELSLVSRVRFNPKARTVTPAQRKYLLRRDCYRCSTPGCRRHLWLDVHHVVFYCRNGATVPRNLTLVCHRCHKNIHEGRLFVTGEAPHDLCWKNKHGQDLMRFRGYRFPPGLSAWFEQPLKPECGPPPGE